MLSRALALVAAVPLAMSAAVAQAAPSAQAGPTSTDGQPIEVVASGLKTPTSFAFGDGEIFEGDGGYAEGSQPPAGGVFLLKAGKGTQIAATPQFVAGLEWHRGSLYVSGGTETADGMVWQLYKWSGWNGTTFRTQRAIYTGPAGFDGFNGLAFGADGRLYVGVDVGLTDGNDHGPASTSPYLYDILSFTAAGRGPEVFATGMRQPWQMAFPAGSDSPYVTDLGQDSEATNPPDFILHVQAGQDYGFPECNHTAVEPCSGFAEPFAQFRPHTDPMGIAISGGKLYVSSFDGPESEGPGGEVFTLPLKGGTPTPAVTGFSGAIVGLAIHGGYLYVGELDGQVFRVKLKASPHRRLRARKRLRSR